MLLSPGENGSSKTATIHLSPYHFQALFPDEAAATTYFE